MSERLVLVTGASGAIGGMVCTALRTGGWRVRALVHRRPCRHADEQVAGSLREPGSLPAAVRGTDVVLHLAAVTHARRTEVYDEVNARGTVDLLEAAVGADVRRFVLVSTRAISPEGGAYSRSKSAAEAAVAGSTLDYTIVRLPEVYGAGGAEGVDRIIGLARIGRPVVLAAADSALVCPVHVGDVVPPLIEALEADRARRKTYTLAGDCLTLRAFAETCIEAFGSRSRIIDLPLTAARLLATAGRLLPLPIYPDQVARLLAPKPGLSSDALDELGFEPRSLEEGLRELA